MKRVDYKSDLILENNVRVSWQSEASSYDPLFKQSLKMSEELRNTHCDRMDSLQEQRNCCLGSIEMHAEISKINQAMTKLRIESLRQSDMGREKALRELVASYPSGTFSK